jgi:predicted acetyltransferase
MQAGNDQAELHIRQASLEEQHVVANLMQAYLQEMSKFDGSLPDCNGQFDCGMYFPLYWSEPTRTPYLFLRSNSTIGFALVREVERKVYSVAEFFVIRAFRGEGLGRFFAKALFDIHRGEWRVAQLESNVTAQRFWRSVISDYSRGKFVEAWSDENPKGPLQIFNSGE